MNQYLKILTVLLCCAPALFAAPNVVVLLVDDMGYSDPGYMGGEAKTPNLDRLAKEGVTFLNCFNNAKCAPTRAALMTGMSCQRVKSFKSKGNITANKATSIAEVLGEKEYTTIIAGKWHIAPDPMDVGFQFRHGVNLAAFYFKRDVVGPPGEKWRTPLWLNGEKVDPQTLPDDWYSTRAYTDFAIKTIKAEAIAKKKPFFLYLSVTAPHAPLSAPKGIVDSYMKTYAAGTDVARQERYQRMIEKGIVDPATWKLPPYEADKEGKVPAWEKFTRKEQQLFQRYLALNAAMVDIVDQETGKLISFLKEERQFENTLFIFLSDNGATSEKGIYGGLDLNKLSEADIARLGTRDGLPGGTSGGIVATVQNTPLRGGKTTLWDGGMRTSMIIHWPGQMNKAATTSLIRTPVSIIDLAPTIYDAAGVSYPQQIRGRKLQPMDGVSILPLIKDQKLSARYLNFSYKNHQVVRDARFKLFGNRGKKNTNWQLFDLQKDKSEIRNIIEQYPDKAKAMIKLWDAFDKDIGIVSGYKSFFGREKDRNKK